MKSHLIFKVRLAIKKNKKIYDLKSSIDIVSI